MGEKPIVELTRKMKELLPAEDASLTAGELKKIAGTIPQTAYLCRATEWTPAADDIQLYSHEECLADKRNRPVISGTSKKNPINMRLPVSHKR